MKRVLAFVDYYLPGSKGGGPAISVSRRAGSLAGRAEFFVFTRDRDLCDLGPYDGVAVDRWNDRPEARVFYCRRPSLRLVLREIREVSPDVLYLNSLFSSLTRVVFLIKLLRLTSARLVLAPRGELDAGALSIKSAKKRVFLWAMRALRLEQKFIWHATSLIEREAIVRVLPCAQVFIAGEASPTPSALRSAMKKAGQCRFVFLSRISRKKNLDFVVRCLAFVKGSAELHVYGPIEDEKYWSEVQADIRRLPEGVAFFYHGAVAHGEVANTLALHDVFVLPTLGENFCHAIAEALAAGVPCLVSDRTPWNDLGRTGAGWSVPLEDQSEWIARLQHCVDLGAEAHGEAAAAALRLVESRDAESSDFEPALAA